MRRRPAAIVGALIALASIAVLVTLSGLLAADRRRDLERYDEAIASQRRAAGQVAARPSDAVAGGGHTEQMCVRGVDTFVTVLHDRLGVSAVDERGRLAPAVLRRLSELATRAERYVEQARARPALPQRLGRERATGADGQPTWKTLSPPTVECEDGDGYAAFRLDVAPAEPATPDQAAK